MTNNNAPSFTVDRAELAKAVAWINAQYGTRYVLPILAAVVIDVGDDDTVTLSAYDYDVYARVTIDAEVGEYGRVLVNRKTLADMLKTAGGPTAELTTTGNKVTLSAGAARFTLATMDADDYPNLPAVPDAVATVDASVLASLAAQVCVSAGKDATRPMLTGVRVEFTDFTVTMAATDSYRLGVAVGEVKALHGDAVSTLIPATTLARVGKAFAKDGIVDIGITHDTASLSAGRRTVTVRTVEGEFPKSRALIPQAAESVAVLPVAPLVAAVKRAKQALDRGAPVVLAFDGDTLTVTSQGYDDEHTEESLTVDYDGLPVTIGFNPDYLLAALKAVNTADALLNLNGANKPGVFEPSDGSQFKHLVMPTRLAA